MNTSLFMKQESWLMTTNIYAEVEHSGRMGCIMNGGRVEQHKGSNAYAHTSC